MLTVVPGNQFPAYCFHILHMMHVISCFHVIQLKLIFNAPAFMYLSSERVISRIIQSASQIHIILKI